jgi:hypothetical protein
MHFFRFALLMLETQDTREEIEKSLKGHKKSSGLAKPQKNYKKVKIK